MSNSRTLAVKVSDDTAREIEMVAIQRGMTKYNGDPNISEALRWVIERGLLSVQLERASGDRPPLTSRVIDTGKVRSALRASRR